MPKKAKKDQYLLDIYALYRNLISQIQHSFLQRNVLINVHSFFSVEGNVVNKVFRIRYSCTFFARVGG